MSALTLTSNSSASSCFSLSFSRASWSFFCEKRTTQSQAMGFLSITVGDKWREMRLISKENPLYKNCREQLLESMTWEKTWGGECILKTQEIGVSILFPKKTGSLRSRETWSCSRETTHLKDICGFKYFVQLSDQESQFGLETTGVVNTVSEKPKNLQEWED